MALKHRPADPELVVRSMPQPRTDAPKVDLRPDLNDLPVLGPDADVPESSHRWVSRPALARLVQLFVLAVPVLASLLVAAVLSAMLPRADRLSTALLWWAVVVVGSTI